MVWSSLSGLHLAWSVISKHPTFSALYALTTPCLTMVLCLFWHRRSGAQASEVSMSLTELSPQPGILVLT